MTKWKLTETYSVEESVSDTFGILLIGDENAADVVRTQKDVSHVVLLFDGRSSACRRALGDEFGGELEELLNAASLKEAERAELVGRLEDTGLAVTAGVCRFV